MIYSSWLLAQHLLLDQQAFPPITFTRPSVKPRLGEVVGGRVELRVETAGEVDDEESCHDDRWLVTDNLLETESRSRRFQPCDEKTQLTPLHFPLALKNPSVYSH